ncbi:hypothetical protein K438DRAFT_1871074 [Mycena galopus ATCC 62051]|nr:hypothetical protein K438DRAFT_1871074 [Mycena galopus ATCC 62051]
MAAAGPRPTMHTSTTSPLHGSELASYGVHELCRRMRRHVESGRDVSGCNGGVRPAWREMRASGRWSCKPSKERES